MKKKVKIWMICSYFFVLALFLVIYLAIQQKTEKKIRELYMERQLALMNQTMLAVDEQVDAVKKLCLGIIREPYVSYFPYVGAELGKYDRENATKLIRDIRKHYTDDPFVEDFYIFYENSGRIAHANGFYQEADFCQMEWSYEDAALQEQAKQLLLQEGSAFLPAAWMENGGRRTNVITFFYDFGNINERGKGAKLVVLLQKTWLDDMMYIMSENGRTSIQSVEDGTVLYDFCRGNEKEEFPDPAFVEGLATDAGRVFKWNHQKYLLTNLNSEKTGWLYRSAIPYEIVTRQMQDTVQPLLAGLFLYLSVGIPACTILAVWNYMPIGQLTSHMESIGFQEKKGHRSEFEYIRSGISDLHQKYAELEIKYGSALKEADTASGKLKKNRERIRESVLLQLLGGYWQDDKEIADRLSGLEIHFPYPYFCVLAIQIEGQMGQAENQDTGDKALWQFVLKNVAQEFLAPMGLVFPVSDSSELLFLLMNLPEEGCEGGQLSKKFEQMLLQLKEYLWRELQITISIGAGTLCDQMNQLTISRRMAKKALEYCFVIGKSSLVVYNHVIRMEEVPYIWDPQFEKQLMASMSQGDKNACRCLLEELYQDALKQKISVSEGKRLHIYLADVAMKAIGKVNLRADAGEECQDMVTSILNSETLPEAIPVLLCLFEKLCGEGEQSEGSQELEKRVMDYISEHYHDSAFSLPMCADYFNVSPEHLSRTIKALTGRKFIDIVNGLRLDQAKQYLRETDKKIEEIAALSGYGTAKSFFRSFKQAEGITPGEYRKQRG